MLIKKIVITIILIGIWLFLATEGKINYYLQPRKDGILEQGNIDIFSERNLKTGGGGKNRFDFTRCNDARHGRLSDLPSDKKEY